MATKISGFSAKILLFYQSTQPGGCDDHKTITLKPWVKNHGVDPNEEELEFLAKKTNLSISCIRRFFLPSERIQTQKPSHAMKIIFCKLLLLYFFQL